MCGLRPVRRERPRGGALPLVLPRRGDPEPERLGPARFKDSRRLRMRLGRGVFSLLSQGGGRPGGGGGGGGRGGAGGRGGGGGGGGRAGTGTTPALRATPPRRGGEKVDV